MKSKIHAGFTDTVGNTPLIKLEKLSEETGCEILGKAEFMNPGGSVKDRAALAIIDAAEASGELKPGGTVIEGTAGNTGIGLVHICNARGYKCIIIIPETQSVEKIELLRTLGAEVRTVPAVPYRDPNNYVKQAGRLAEETENSIWANQFDNVANRQGHYNTTGREIWEQCDGQLDAWITSMGTGGTFTGVAMYLKDQNPAIKTVIADPYGSAFYNYIKHGELKSEGGSITEGIGNSRITANMVDMPVDDCIRIHDREAVAMVDRLLAEEGLFLGGSCGINVGGAYELAKQMGPGHRIVTILCDSGARYQSKLFNQEFRESKGLA